MIKIAATVFCDNESCPDETQVEATIALTVESWNRAQVFFGVASELTDDGLELPKGWIKYEGKTYCSKKCAEAT